MKTGIVVVFVTALLISAFIIAAFLLQKTPDVKQDIIRINDMVQTISDNWDVLQSGNGELDCELDCAVIDNNGNLVARTRRGLNENINDAIKNRDTIADIRVGGETVGKVIFYNDTALILKQNRTNLTIAAILIFLFMIIVIAGYTLYLRAAILGPFNKLTGLAQRIAAGNLDIPLEMFKHNLFGAFTESFDLMREELRKARENERRANQSKKELVASLSHDIKTPVASIKAVAELMLVNPKDEEDKKQLEIIGTKAEQINSLITNMFHATLEELQALPVTVAEIHSTAIPSLLQNADYKGTVKPFPMPNCIVMADAVRLQQVFDNIIGNSYKYAGTDIEINVEIETALKKPCAKRELNAQKGGGFSPQTEERHLIIEVIDFGKGVAEDELPLIFNKFYRGKSAGGESGYGLGLYISKYLLEQMAGGIRCENRSDGFCVCLMLRLAG